MGWLEILNSLLNLKLVQHLLLLSVSILLATGIWLKIENYTLKGQKLYYETEYSKVSAGLAIQNEAVELLGEERKKADNSMKEAVDKASKLASQGSVKLKTIVEYKFIGTCDEQVTQALKLIRGGK